MNRSTSCAGVLAAICLTACTGSLFQSKAAPPTIYMLSVGALAPTGAAAGGSGSAAPAAGGLGLVAAAAGGPGLMAAAGAPGSVIPVDLAVLKPRLRPGLESDRIAVLYPDRHLDYFAGARWSGPLGEVLQDLAVQELRSRADQRAVSGDASVFASAYWLEIEVLDFQAEYTSAAAAPTVRVQLLARLGGSGDRRILAQFAASAQQPAAENRLTAIVGAYELAADAAFAQITARSRETLVKASEAR